MPLAVKVQAALLNGPEGNTVHRLEDLNFDRQPPLQIRIRDENTRHTSCKWFGLNHRENTDIPEIARTRHMSAKQAGFVRKVTARRCKEQRKSVGLIASRPFPKKEKQK